MKAHLSKLTLVTLFLALFAFRATHVTTKELGWDVLGYYLPLPAAFIHDDFQLNDITWLEEANENYDLTGTLYMVGKSPRGENMYFFLFGTAVFYSPFFFVGHLLAPILGFEQDGFSQPYQYAMALGCMLYVLIGLIFLRKILRLYFNEWITSVVMIVVVLATNYAHHLTLKNMETVTLLFMFVAMIVWNTIKWHEQQKLKNLLAIGVSIAFMAIIKPSEIVVGIIPVLWGISNVASLQEKIQTITRHWKQFALTIAFGLLVLFPQLLYWKITTGTWIYDSYKNPGVGLDFTSPHIIDALFSYKKGWFLYTPVAVLFIMGLYFTGKQNKSGRLAILSYFFISFYIITSWSEWWYGAAFSNRPLITTYPLLAIGFGYLLSWAFQHKIWKFVVLTFVASAMILNQFMWWQMRHYILDPYRMTKNYFWATFLSTSVDSETRELMAVERDFSGKMIFPKNGYYEIEVDGLTNSAYENQLIEVAEAREFALTIKKPFEEITQKDHAWITISFEWEVDSNATAELPIFITTFERKEGTYQYVATDFATDSKTENGWSKLSVDYLTPIVRSKSDDFKCYIWNRGRLEFRIRNFDLKVWEKKPSFL